MKVFMATRDRNEVIFEGEALAAAKFADEIRRELRKMDPNGTETDVYLKSDEEIERERAAAARWDALTEEEKKDIIEVDGRRYVRKIWEANR